MTCISPPAAECEMLACFGQVAEPSSKFQIAGCCSSFQKAFPQVCLMSCSLPHRDTQTDRKTARETELGHLVPLEFILDRKNIADCLLRSFFSCTRCSDPTGESRRIGTCPVYANRTPELCSSGQIDSCLVGYIPTEVLHPFWLNIKVKVTHLRLFATLSGCVLLFFSIEPLAFARNCKARKVWLSAAFFPVLACLPHYVFLGILTPPQPVIVIAIAIVCRASSWQYFYVNKPNRQRQTKLANHWIDNDTRPDAGRCSNEARSWLFPLGFEQL